VDEAQDFPPEFFRVLLGLSREPHCIYFAYDELQNIFSPDLPDPGELFGRDEVGRSLIDFEGSYDGGIEKDFVLHRSYRCPMKVLMLAHALGLGIHGENGPVQMLGSIDSWRSIGYEVETEALVTGQPVTIRRPTENSPNPIVDIYKGTEPLIVTKIFDDRQSELEWVARSVIHNVQNEGIAPDQVIVISLNARQAKKFMVELQSQLLEEGIPSTIPGLIDSSSEFGVPGKVTLATVSRAKGNEAPLVYILAFDEIYNYVEEIENRNMAFTAISRSKGWVRISGIGGNMRRAEKEMLLILDEVPLFRFRFPDLDKIRNLDAEVSRRRREAQKAKLAAQQLSSSELEAVRSLDTTLKAQILKSLLKDAVSEDELKNLVQQLKSAK